MEVAAAPSPICIVIIDDNPRSLEFLAAALSQPGVQVLTSSNPHDGLALIALHRPQLVLTDLAMPGMSGLDVLHRVKQLDQTIQVIIMSAQGSGGSPARALEQGAADYLAKPISLSILRQRVGRHLQKHLPDDHNS